VRKCFTSPVSCFFFLQKQGFSSAMVMFLCHLHCYTCMYCHEAVLGPCLAQTQPLSHTSSRQCSASSIAEEATPLLGNAEAISLRYALSFGGTRGSMLLGCLFVSLYSETADASRHLQFGTHLAESHLRLLALHALSFAERLRLEYRVTHPDQSVRPCQAGSSQLNT